MEKVCRCCKQTKPIFEYYKHKQMADGRLNICKVCIILNVRKRRYDPISRGKILAYDRSRGSRQTKEYLKEYRKKYPNKYKAHVLVGNAIRDKRLFKEPCSVCGTEMFINAHHDDYAKPLNVRWLCSSHHHQWHAEHGEALNPF